VIKLAMALLAAAMLLQGVLDLVLPARAEDS
jgi:hypothetical protein